MVSKATKMIEVMLWMIESGHERERFRDGFDNASLGKFMVSWCVLSIDTYL